MNLSALLLCLRPKQWTKNLLLFAGLVFAGEFRNLSSVLHAIAAFLVFCFLSGVVYIVNDIMDLEKDRQHPKKRKRPIASGAVSPFAAGVWAAVLGVGSLAASALWLPLGFTVTAAFYVALVCAYSLFLKHVVILDILALAMGFVLRALAGIEALPVEGLKVTGYFILTTLFLALFLAICKRRNELTILGEGAAHHRAVLREYSVEFLDTLLTVATAGVLFSYASWTTQGQFAQLRAAGENSGVYVMVFTMPFVIFGIFRYIWLVYQKDEGGAPEMLLVEDLPLLATVALWILATMTVLVLFGSAP